MTPSPRGAGAAMDRPILTSAQWEALADIAKNGPLFPGRFSRACERLFDLGLIDVTEAGKRRAYIATKSGKELLDARGGGAR